jgi:hypothetical protein
MDFVNFRLPSLQIFTLFLLRRDNTIAENNRKIRLKHQPFNLGAAFIEASARAVKTPGGGFVLTRFLLPFHPRLPRAGIGKGRVSPA